MVTNLIPDESPEEEKRRIEREEQANRLFPEIEFIWTPTSRVARPRGVGIEVWEIVRAIRDWGRGERTVTDNFDQLAFEHVRLALEFHEQFPEEVDGRLRKDDAWTDARIMAFNMRMAAYRERGSDSAPVDWSHPKTEDERHLRFAVTDGRCMVTRNRADYIHLTQCYAEREWPHRGVSLLPTEVPNTATDAIVEGFVLLKDRVDLPRYTVEVLRTPG